MPYRHESYDAHARKLATFRAVQQVAWMAVSFLLMCGAVWAVVWALACLRAIFG
jgi:hypothetical protein